MFRIQQVTVALVVVLVVFHGAEGPNALCSAHGPKDPLRLVYRDD